MPIPTPTPTPTPTPDPLATSDATDVEQPGLPIIGNAVPRIRNTLIDVVTTPRQRNTLIIILIGVGVVVILVFAYLIWRRR